MFGQQSIILKILGDTDENLIIDYLLGKIETDVSIPDISEHTGVSRPTVYRIMEDLQDEELVEVTRKIGKINLFRICKDHERIQLMLLAQSLITKAKEG